MNDVPGTPQAPPPSPYVPPAAPLDPMAGKPQNFLVWAILATLCCCVPTGIAAIVFAAQVDGKWAGGDHAGAIEASEKAKLWSIISLAIGLVGSIIYGVLVFASEGAYY